MSIPSSRPTWLGVWDENISWEIARAIFPTIHGRSDRQPFEFLISLLRGLVQMQLSETCQWCASAHARMAQFNIKSQGAAPMPPVTWVLISVGSVREVPASRANTTLPAPVLLRSKCNINQCPAVKEVSPMLYVSKWLHELLLVQTSAQQLGMVHSLTKYTWILNTRNGHVRLHMHNANWKTWSHVLLYLSSIYVHTFIYHYVPVWENISKSLKDFFLSNTIHRKRQGAAESHLQVSPGRVAIVQKSPWHVPQTEHPRWVVQGASCWNNFGRGSDLRLHHASPAMFPSSPTWIV